MYKKELKVAVLAANRANLVIQNYSRQNIQVEHKSADQPVTKADKEANAIIQKTLLSEFPKDGWLSEETLDNSDRLGKNRVWIVDPLDGTKEFINRVPEYCVSIALAYNGEIVVGVISNPATNEIFSCTKGGGAFLNDKKINVTTTSHLKSSKILASRSEISRDEWKTFKGHFEIVATGGMAHKMSVVACGRGDGSFTLNPKNEWDFAAGVLLIQEAGGIVTLLDGTKITFNNKNPKISGLIFGNPSIYQDLKLRTILL